GLWRDYIWSCGCIRSVFQQVAELKNRKEKFRGPPPRYWIKNCMSRPRGVKNAFGKYCSGVDRGRDGVVLDQSLHSHGLQHQVDLERGRGGCRRGLGVASHGAVGA